MQLVSSQGTWCTATAVTTEMTPDGLYISVNNSIEEVSSLAELSLLGRSVLRRESQEIESDVLQ